MKTTKKRILSFLLVAVFLTQFIPFAVSAAPGTIRVFATADLSTIVPNSGVVTINVNVTIDASAMPAGYGIARTRYFLMFDSTIFTLLTPYTGAFGIPSPVPPVVVCAGASMPVSTLFNPNPAMSPPNVLPTEEYIFMGTSAPVPSQDVLGTITKTYTFEVNTNALPSPLPNALYIRLYHYESTSNLNPTINRRRPAQSADHARIAVWTQPTVARFHFDGGVVNVPITIGQPINPALIPTPATRYGRVGTPGQVFMGWFTEIFPLMHYVNNANRATAFNLSTPITANMLSNGVLHLHGSWLQFGDVNGDGAVNGRDFLLLEQFLAFFPVILGIPAP